MHCCRVIFIGFPGVTYVRWGRTDCQSPATLVYSGSAAGQHHTHGGGASDPLCLPATPNYRLFGDQASNFIYGAEYELAGGAQRPYSRSKFQERDVPCAVCLAKGKTETLMLPARDVCPPGWHREYRGYLTSGHYGHSGRQQFTCLDEKPAIIPGRDANTNGYLFYTVGVECNHGIPCGPYKSRRELTCAVCSR